MKKQGFFLKVSTLMFAGATVASLLLAAPLRAQVTGNTTTGTDAQGNPTATSTLTFSNDKKKKEKVAKEDRVQQTKDTVKEEKKVAKFNPLAEKDAQLPDKQLYDKALAQEKSGHYDVARLDLQTLLNTYPDSQYQMRAKLAVADSWYREGGSAALAQAEQEYKDFITFFPNAPEAAEAQMRVGDIYFKQMDVPDRDYVKAIDAEAEYRTMLKQYPDAPPEILKQAKQKLREVQEVLASREAIIADFYATHENWPAAIARYKTVVDTYPSYSHMDDVMIALGDAYAAESRLVRARLDIPEGPRGKLMQEDDRMAADMYRKVVLEHAAAPHAEDAKDRLLSMGLPVPTPSAEQLAASEELEGSRAQYTMRNRLELLFVKKPDTVLAAQIGEPSLEDPAATTAPMEMKRSTDQFMLALNPNAVIAKPVVKTDGTTEQPDTPAAVPTGGTPMLQDVPTAGSGEVHEMTNAEPAASGATSNSLGVEVLTPGVSSVSTGSGAASNLPAATGAQDKNYGLTSVTPKNSTDLPPAEKPADSPDQVNEAAGKATPPAQAPAADGKKTPKPELDKDDESSSKKKPKKGLDKLNPF